MKIIIAGGTGLIGRHLIRAGMPQGHSFVVLTRGTEKSMPSDIRGKAEASRWNPDENKIDPSVFKGADAVINLAGEDIAGGRWTKARKKSLFDSRILPTRLLSTSIEKLEEKPEVFLSASAVGYYRPEQKGSITEDSDHGTHFISELCRSWEREANPSGSPEVRTIKGRFGIVLSKDGGALKKMLLPFSLGLGGRLGSGKQYMSWISMEDLTSGILYCLTHKKISGPVNFTSPVPVTNAEFTKTLGKVLGRPTILPVPPIVLRTLFGEMAEPLLLSSLPVVPEKLLLNRFEFQGKDLETVLRKELET